MFGATVAGFVAAGPASGLVPGESLPVCVAAGGFTATNGTSARGMATGATTGASAASGVGTGTGTGSGLGTPAGVTAGSSASTVTWTLFCAGTIPGPLTDTMTSCPPGTVSVGTTASRLNEPSCPTVAAPSTTGVECSSIWIDRPVGRP